MIIKIISKYINYKLFKLIRLKDVIPNSIIRIKKGNKNGNLMDKKKKFCNNEFNYLYNLIDNNNEHKMQLDPLNGNCRYKNVLTYKTNRVILNTTKRYINASWIHIPFKHYFIATQGPLPHTIEDFWTMCYEYKVTVIIMLCNLKENNVDKCANYWDVNNLYNFEIKKLEEKKEDSICKRTIEIINKTTKERMIINQIQLLCWDDHTALNTNYFNKVTYLINSLDKYRNNRSVVVHCSAGVGRTGSFICMYILYHEITQQIYYEKNSEVISFSIMNLVRKMKEMRMLSIENVNQLSLLYEFVNYLLINYNIRK